MTAPSGPKIVHMQSVRVVAVTQYSGTQAEVTFATGTHPADSFCIYVPMAAAYQYHVGQKFGLTLEEE